MSTDSSMELRQCAERIVSRVDEWLEKYGVFAPLDKVRRREIASNWRQGLRALVGLVTPVSLPPARRLIFFEGLRDKQYHQFFSPHEVVILGSHREREYARANGYGFAWSFPLESAVRVALTRGRHFFLTHQLRSWADLLRTYESIGVFLYEDTQPLGACFANLPALVGPHVSVVCIQHGYFPKPLNDLPLDGSVSQVNFVWDQKQADLIGSAPQKTFVIGPPICAVAKPTRLPSIILVGTGTRHDGTGDYERTIGWYKSLLDLLPEQLQKRTWYRPHPNELVNRADADRLAEWFPNLDLLPLAERLGGEVAVFLGSLSSVLFEARYSGHIVVRVALRDDAIPLFERHAEFSAEQMTDVAKWLEATCTSGEVVGATPVPRPHVKFPAIVKELLSSPQ